MTDIPKRPRITKKQIKKFVEWLYLKHDYEFLMTTSTSSLRRYFKIDTGILVSRKFIEDTRHKWIVIDEKLYRIDQPWTHPKLTDSVQK